MRQRHSIALKAAAKNNMAEFTSTYLYSKTRSAQKSHPIICGQDLALVISCHLSLPLLQKSSLF
jgi:hypothetical protein